MILIQNRKQNASLVILDLEKLINFDTSTSELAHCMSFEVRDNLLNNLLSIIGVNGEIHLKMSELQSM